MGELPRRIAITGASGYIGTRLIARLEREASVERIVALDLRPCKPSAKVVFYQQDVRAPLSQVLAENSVEAVVHLAFVLQPGHDRRAIHRVNVEGAKNVLQACAQAQTDQILYLSSTTVYGAHPDNPVPLTEESPVRPVSGFQYAEDKAEVEGTLDQFAREHPDTAVTVLRGCVVMGPNADNFISRALSKPILVSVRGCDPPMQFLHEDDLVETMARCLGHRPRGVYNVAGSGTVRWSQMVRLSGRRLIPLPAALIYGITEVSWRLRLQRDSPSCGLDFIRYPWVASTDKIQQHLGLQVRHSSLEALTAFLERKEFSRVQQEAP